MDFSRRSGVLLHPSSLPGPWGRGDAGPAAEAFLRDLAGAGQSVWQMLPLGPPGYGGSPYASGSAFAGDTLLVSPERLVAQGWLVEGDLDELPRFPEGRVHFEGDGPRRRLLRRARQRFDQRAIPAQREQLDEFQRAQAHWLDDYALFSAIKEAHGGGPFWEWPEGLRRRDPAALERARRELADEVRDEVFAQWAFHHQWRGLRSLAHTLGIELFGDVPIFVARDSADLWAHPGLFHLDRRGEPQVVAGVPPDLFSKTGQLWGNPLYDWDAHARTGYRWWVQRMRRTLELVDLVRIDHFRGFAAYWAIPAGQPTAVHGKWVRGPGIALFDALRDELGDVPVIAEDLGVITDDVKLLRDRAGLPGMKILHFAWHDRPDPEHEYLPENHSVLSVSYTGTHDNETTAGWFAGLAPQVRAQVGERVSDQDPVWDLIELSSGSRAFLSIVPAQDLLGLGNEARMNTPAVAEGNWLWRLLPGQLDRAALERLGRVTALHKRARGGRI